MRKFFTIVCIALSWTASGQIHQDVNKTNGSTESNPINYIDSIRFNGSLTEMEIIYLDNSIESHILSEIDNVTFSGSLIGEISNLNCSGTTVNGTIYEGSSANGMSAIVGYTGGNGGTHNGQAVNSTGVNGLTAYLPAGNFGNGNGTLSYALTGTPFASGIATFTLNIGGETCNLGIVVQPQDPYPNGTVHCDAPTQVVAVTNPFTGETWMDRNLGASQAATRSSDPDSYGDLYQWGRGSDGHQCRNSPITGTLSTVDQPGHGDFIVTMGNPNNWRTSTNPNLWQGENGINNPCPNGYRLPTEAEFQAERQSWTSNNSAGAFSSNLKLPRAGSRTNSTGEVTSVGIFGRYWTSTFFDTYAYYLDFSSTSAYFTPKSLAVGLSVRCIMD